MTETNPLLAEGIEVVTYWVREREAVRKAKAAGQAKPWSNDPLFQRYRWCNVSRMDDRVSVELMRDWYREASSETQLVAATLGRLINWPEALLDATGGRPFSLDLLPGARQALHARASAGAKVFTAAYLVPAAPGRSNKIDSILDLVEEVRHEAGGILLQETLHGTWEALTRFKGLGGFLAGQITADLAYLSTGERWPDRFSWAPVGPGSARGMNRLRGRPKDKALRQSQFDDELQEFIAVMTSRVPDIAADRRLGAQDWQSVLCEGDKAIRMQRGEGKMRSNYDGAGTAQGSLF